ncbi:S8 family peptidase [Bacillus sp. NEB1478]|uniref:S8 family peptidase n=1 Tax=Bacillus sp. NEB1478 TaxID=3073816 RepID=UPI002873D8DE|nr:S8 family peptidase [Bacillus sp. NEB1478]WNB92677.1 S8 family peptidase [Bacillus sp. NEB1478]
MNKWKKQLAVLGLSTSLVATGIPLKASALNSVKNENRLLNQFINTKLDAKKKDQPSFSKDTLIIKYNHSITLNEHSRAGATPIRSVPSLNYTVVKIKKKGTMDQVLKAYKKLGKVEVVSPSVMYTTQTTNDPKASKQYHLSLLQLEKAQQLAGNASVKVAVIDQGADRDHPELQGQLLPGYNTVNPTNQPTPDFHGTHVSGIIAAKKNNGVGGYGVNPNAKILNIDVFDRDGGAYDFAIADAILYAVNHGAKVINMSLGGSMPSPLIEDAVKKAINAKVTVVAAAGNEGNDSLSYPAAYEGVISVGSTNSANKLSSYSSYGPSVDLVAPGEKIYAPIYELERKSSFDYLSGTSMATPVVAGVASLLLAKNPNLTPAQVEYVLEHTAKDLGTRGFDVRYANGLVNPVAALSYDVKKIPASVKNPVTQTDILAKAKKINLTGKYSYSGKITKANEIQWIKFEVKKGEYIQTSLIGAAAYDYKYKMNLYSKEGNKYIDVNQVREGKTEGKLYKVPYSGTLAIGIKDVNGSFDDSGKGLSHFTLNIQKDSKLLEDNVDLAHPVVINSLPYSSKSKSLTLTGSEGDEDYFKFSVKNKQLVRLKLTGVPGVDTSLNVYLADQLTSTESEDEPAEPMFYSNSLGYGEGETLVFEAEPEMEYAISVSNMRNYYDWEYDFYMNEDMVFVPNKPASSNLPYVLSAEGKVLPADEDNYPLNQDMTEDDYEDGAINTEDYVKLKQESRDLLHKLGKAEEGEEDEGEIDFELIKESALKYEIGKSKTGYLQNLEDEDWYVVNPGVTGIYGFNFTSKPMVEVYQLVKEEYDGESFEFFSQIGGNYTWDWYGVNLKNELNVGLKKGKPYYIRVMNDQFSENGVLYNSYSFTSGLKVNNPEDKYENNDSLDNAKYLPASKFTGNFAMPNDQDVFYLKPNKLDTLFGVNIDRSSVTKDLLKKYPAELLDNFYSAAVIFEDTNNNRKLDDNEYDTMRFIERGWESGNTSGSFLAKKGKGYVIAIIGFTEGINPTLLPYSATIAPVNTKDEDDGSVIKNNKPSKPLTFKKESSKKYTAQGYLNASVPNGDSDWYTLNVDQDRAVQVTFGFKNDIDGIISIYKDGQLVQKADYYRLGDSEILRTNLKKGTYYIEVKDTNRNASLNPYSLNVYY